MEGEGGEMGEVEKEKVEEEKEVEKEVEGGKRRARFRCWMQYRVWRTSSFPLATVSLAPRTSESMVTTTPPSPPFSL
jgi:hypothetical protein